jgi:hypothetical protein
MRTKRQLLAEMQNYSYPADASPAAVGQVVCLARTANYLQDRLPGQIIEPGRPAHRRPKKLANHYLAVECSTSAAI